MFHRDTGVLTYKLRRVWDELNYCISVRDWLSKIVLIIITQRHSQEDVICSSMY